MRVKRKTILPSNWTPLQQGTLVYLVRDSSVLLIHKLTGHGAGRINAPGGRLEEDESIYQCAVREVREEVGIRAGSLNPAAALRFHDFGNGFSMTGYVYTSTMFEGDAVSTNEANPFWCDIGEIPYGKMWQDDALWLPRVLAGDCIFGDFVFENDRLRCHEVRRVGRSEIWQRMQGCATATEGGA